MTTKFPDGSVQIDDMNAMLAGSSMVNSSAPKDTSTHLCQLVYLSSASAAYSKDDLVDILSTSRRNNTAKDVTGLLLYHDGNIIQFLEGDSKAIQDLYNKIVGDRRHKGVLPILTRKIQRRDFGAWSMGFKNVTEEEKDRLEGFTDLMNSLSTHSVADPDISKPVQRLIRSYRQLWETERNGETFA